jgi:hypothetical protein
MGMTAPVEVLAGGHAVTGATADSFEENTDE